MLNFCHIAPTRHLKHFCEKQEFDLVLAHLVESDPDYAKFYRNKKSRKILDNSAFEMYKQGREMYPSDKLIEMGKAIEAEWVVMTDYPGQHSDFTIEAAIDLAPKFKAEGFGTFFVPQGEEGNLDDLLHSFDWATKNRASVDYIGISILAAPLAFGVEQGNRLQRMLSRWKLMQHLDDRKFFKSKGILQNIHMLGMVDGPNEIQLMHRWRGFIDTWDSSNAVWAGLNGLSYDNSPTGLINGKFEKEVDFNHFCDDVERVVLAFKNMEYIDQLVEEFN